MSLVIELTPSEQWAAKQVMGTLTGAIESRKKAQKALNDAGEIERATETYCGDFVQSVLKAHQKSDPGSIPAIEASKIGMRMTWRDPPPPPKPVVHPPDPPKEPKPEPEEKKGDKPPSPAKKVAAKRGKKKAKKILKDGSVRGKKLTPKRRRFFDARAN